MNFAAYDREEKKILGERMFNLGKKLDNIMIVHSKKIWYAWRNQAKNPIHPELQKIKIS